MTIVMVLVIAYNRSANAHGQCGRPAKGHFASLDCTRSAVEKAPRAMRAMRGNTLETVPFQPYFACTESFLKVLSSERFQATRPMRAKRVVTVHRNGTLGSHDSLCVMPKRSFAKKMLLRDRPTQEERTALPDLQAESHINV